MAAVTQAAFDNLQSEFANYKSMVDLQVNTMNTHINELIAQVVSPGGSTDAMRLNIDRITAELNVRDAQIKTELENYWNIKDPKMRGTTKFDGDKKENARTFVQWRNAPTCT